MTQQQRRPRQRPLENGFIPGTSVNLPIVDEVMVLQYIMNNVQLYAAEYQHKRTFEIARSTYCEAAMGWVQVNISDDESIVTVKTRVTAQHRDQVSYPVTTRIDVNAEEIISSTCSGCAAAAGGCKHAMSVVFWLLKKNNEPPTTEVICYWRGAEFRHTNMNRCKSLSLLSVSTPL